MRDKRRDSGEYYPGGRVIARPGTAPQQVVVQWSDVQGKPQIAPLPERYKDSDMKTKINEIAAKLSMTIAVALVGFTALAGLVVHKAPKASIYNDDEVVTNVTFDASAIPADYETVSNRAMNSVQFEFDVNSNRTALTVGNRKQESIGESSVVFGEDSSATGLYSFVNGVNARACGDYSHAEGIETKTTASGKYAHAEGAAATASGYYSHAEGFTTVASGMYAHAEGDESVASGDGSHVEGYNNTASGGDSHAEGANTTAAGAGSHAEGFYTTASSDGSHAEGDNTTANGKYAHAEGSSTTASGYSSHAEGAHTTASGNGAHAEGYNTVAKGVSSHADGIYASANDSFSYVWGGTEHQVNQVSKGIGTFCIYPMGGIAGFFVDGKSLDSIIKAQADAVVSSATYTKTETDALIAANKPEYEDPASNVVWRIEAEGGRFFFKPVRPVHTED